MKLKIPPVLQFVLSVFIMWLIQELTQEVHFSFKGQEILSWVLFIAGTLLGISGIFAFKKEQTTTNPLYPSKTALLVTSGIYKYTRNPMYLGLLFILIAFANKLGNFYTIPILFLYVWYITTFIIKPEEEALTKLFGKEYRNYCQKVRRWL